MLTPKPPARTFLLDIVITYITMKRKI
jgi:hypothetical protein